MSRSLFSSRPTRRFLVYRSADSRFFLCVCAATSPAHALRIARRQFRLTRTAYAIPESRPEPAPIAA